MQAFNGKPATWNAAIAQLPNPHLLQTWEWAQAKSNFGWRPEPFLWRSSPQSSLEPTPTAAAMVLERVIPIGGFAKRMSVLYIPKGPLMDWQNATLRNQVLDDLQNYARMQGAIFIKSDPDLWVGTGIPGTEETIEDEDVLFVKGELLRRGWLFSQDQVQFRNTVLIDLLVSEEEMLMWMKQKMRYNIRLAEKKGVKIRLGVKEDLPLLFKMYAETSIRDGFIIREEEYYRTVWNTFLRKPAGVDQPFAEPLIAEVDGQPVAAIFLFCFAGRAYYLYGMSSPAHREKMPNHLLQWEAMRRAKASGCTVYDLWGAPDDFTDSDSLWSVYRFKEGLGGKIYRGLGAWDHSSRPLLYKLYTQIIPRLLDIMRLRGKARTRRSLG